MPSETRKGFMSPGAGVIDYCDPLNVGSRHQTQVFCRRGVRWLLTAEPSHLSSLCSSTSESRKRHAIPRLVERI